ncbi:acetyl-CoA synthetase-like protein, partial [Piedraia hortae CBS 480.64]
YGNLVDFTLAGTYDPDKPVIIDAETPSRTISLRQARDGVEYFQRFFSPRTTVCTHLQNDVNYPLYVLGIMAAGAIWTGTNTSYTAAELKHHFTTSNTTCVITEIEHLDTVQAAIHASGIKIKILVASDLANSAVKMRGPRPYICPTSTAVMMNTSGTTGLPKIAARTHRAFLAELLGTGALEGVKHYEVRRLFCIPIFHGFGAPEMIFNALHYGHVSFFMRRMDETFAQKVHDFGITETYGAPPLMLRLVNDPSHHHLLQSLRRISFGGAKLTPELRKQTLSMFKIAPRIVPVYGMTEGGWFTTCQGNIDDEGAAAGSVGRPIAGITIKIEGQFRLSDGNTGGEIMISGPQLMTAYFRDQAATSETIINGWLRTGDLGYIKNGHVYLIDRLKDLIKISGFQVAPAELEEVLRRHSGIVDASVFGAGVDVDEHPVVCVVRRPGASNTSVAEIKAHLRSQLTRYKVNRCEIVYVDSIPKSAAGKVQRKALREKA